MIIVSYYTPGYYAEVASERLLPSLRALGLPHDVREVLLGGKWAKRTQFKAEFLQHARGEHPGSDLLWVDVDAVVHRDPAEELADYNACDLAVHLLRGVELLSGTIYLPAAGERTDELLRRWRAANENNQAWDQRNLAAAIERMEYEGRPAAIGHLPPQLCFIHDTMRQVHPGVTPVIEHFQASRRLRKQGQA